ncbi:hypothetical protein Vafri_4885 [Volvox africanus]|uniref:Uncharacterized protein n=1 Tax=Volvox africanus TaxID=51714 RepID=A0A8J4AW47_9CHLO|nr:hypothetical protein Vafri_4885 [Volvox africanus]
MAANKCCAASASHIAGTVARDQVHGHVSLANAIAHLNTVSAGVSVEPADYNWGIPSLLQQQALCSQVLQLAFMCTLPQMHYAHLSACPSLQPGRPTLFPSFLPPFPGFMAPVAAPSLAPSPSPPPCSPAAPQVSGQQAQAKSSAARPDGPSSKAGKNLTPSKKSSGSKLKVSKNVSAGNNAISVASAGVASKAESDIELEDICRLLGDDAFLEHLQDDVLSEGSNGSSSTSDGRVLSKNNSNCCLSGSVNNDGSLFAANTFASAFDMDVDDPTPTAAASDCKPAPTIPPSSKTSSGDLNNLVAASAPRSTRASRSAARDAAKDAAAAAAVVSPAKITLKVTKGGVQKGVSSKPSKSQAAVAAAAVAVAIAAEVPPTDPQPQPEECALTAADLSRLLGEDDNRIPEGWDLDLDFENPFSCSISAF